LWMRSWSSLQSRHVRLLQCAISVRSTKWTDWLSLAQPQEMKANVRNQTKTRNASHHRRVQAMRVSVFLTALAYHTLLWTLTLAHPRWQNASHEQEVRRRHEDKAYPRVSTPADIFIWSRIFLAYFTTTLLTQAIWHQIAEVQVTLRLTACRSVCPGVGHPFGAHDQSLLFPFLCRWIKGGKRSWPNLAPVRNREARSISEDRAPPDNEALLPLGSPLSAKLAQYQTVDAYRVVRCRGLPALPPHRWLSALRTGRALLSRNIISSVSGRERVNPEGLGTYWKNSFTSLGLEPATFRLVA
jgi:hypothetical protein